MEKMDKKIKELHRDIKALEKIIDKKKAMFEKRNIFVNSYLDNNDDYMPFRVGRYDEEVLEKLPGIERWTGSYYFTHQVQIEHMITSTLSKEEISKLMNVTLSNPLTEALVIKKMIRVVCMLDAGIPSENGFQFFLSDPYGMLTVYVTDKDLIHKVLALIGEFIYAEIELCNDQSIKMVSVELFVPKS